MIPKGTTRRAFLIGIGGLGLGAVAYWFLRSLGFGKGTETPIPTSTPTSTLTPTSTSTPTLTPEPTTTPTSTPTPTPTINREEVERLKSRYKEILVKEYPILYKLLTNPSLPIFINYDDIKAYWLKRIWETSSDLINEDRTFIFSPIPRHDGKIEIILPIEADRQLYETRTAEDRLEIEAIEGIKEKAPVDEFTWQLDETRVNSLEIRITVKVASLNEEIQRIIRGNNLVLEALPGKGKLCKGCVVEIAAWNVPRPKKLTPDDQEKYYLTSIFLVVLMQRLAHTPSPPSFTVLIERLLNVYKLHFPENTLLASPNSFQAVKELLLEEVILKWKSK
jgi:hypothetical protein